jgi:hypothetical protein
MSGDAITTAATANSLSAVRGTAASRHIIDHQTIERQRVLAPADHPHHAAARDVDETVVGERAARHRIALLVALQRTEPGGDVHAGQGMVEQRDK